MHLPLELWCASQEGLTPSVQDPITKFSARILEVKEKNVGLFLFGDVGSGKTGAACVVLKEARAWGFTAYAISVTELRDAARTYAAFDSESTIMDRARNVDFLLLDDLRKEDTDEKIFGINDIRNLIVGRHDRGLPTIITSLIGSNTWGETVPSIQAAAEKCCASQKVIGPNRHKITAKAKNDLLK